jgi:hypothetical protein
MRYKGYHGQIEVDGQTLVITRDGRVARIGFGKDTPPRRIPLQAISGVNFKDASRLTNGWIQLLLGGVEKARPTTGTAASDPDVVMFTHGDRQVFAELNSWLLAMVATNRELDMDPTTVAFDAGEGRQGRLAARQEELEAKLAAKRQELADRGQALRQPASEDREDIATAVARMGWKLGGKREIKKLTEHLNEGELVRFIAQGAYRNGQGIVVLTDQRLLFVFHGLVRQAVEDFPLDRISSVATKSGMVTGEVKVHASGNEAVISHIVKADLKLLADALRDRLAGQSNDSAQPTSTQPVAAPQPDVLDQLRKLAELRDAGTLTSHEFDTRESRTPPPSLIPRRHATPWLAAGDQHEGSSVAAGNYARFAACQCDSADPCTHIYVVLVDVSACDRACRGSRTFSARKQSVSPDRGVGPARTPAGRSLQRVVRWSVAGARPTRDDSGR